MIAARCQNLNAAAGRKGDADQFIRALSGLSLPGCVEAHPEGLASRRQHGPAMSLRFSLPDYEIPEQFIGLI